MVTCSNTDTEINKGSHYLIRFAERIWYNFFRFSKDFVAQSYTTARCHRMGPGSWFALSEDAVFARLVWREAPVSIPVLVWLCWNNSSIIEPELLLVSTELLQMCHRMLKYAGWTPVFEETGVKMKVHFEYHWRLEYISAAPCKSVRAYFLRCSPHSTLEWDSEQICLGVFL